METQYQSKLRSKCLRLKLPQDVNKVGELLANIMYEAARYNQSLGNNYYLKKRHLYVK